MLVFFSVFSFLLKCALAGKGDTIDQLKVSYGNIDLTHAFNKVNVKTIDGEVPKGLNGTLIRHGCGVFGNTFGAETEDLDRVNHLFDCIELAQSFHFYEGQAFFSSRYYDTNRNDYFLNVHDQDMTKSSVFYGTVFANSSADARDDFNKWRSDNANTTSLKNNDVPHVSWWLIGNDVIANGEGQDGTKVDPHNIVNFKDYSLGGSWPEHDRLEFNPAHEVYDEKLGLINTVGLYKFNEDRTEQETKRIVYTIKQMADGSNKREYIAEIPYPKADLSGCQTGQVPDPNTWLKYLHTIASTENYIIVPETSYMRNPCDNVLGGAGPGYLSPIIYNESINGVFSIIPKAEPENVMTFDAGTHFFITHQFNAFEEDEDLIHVDVIHYNSAEPYTQFTFIDEAVFGDTSPDQELRRYSLNMTSGNVSYKKLYDMNEGDYVEFPNCNPNFAGNPYRYGYAARNVFRLNNAVMKFDFEQPENTVAFELNDGEFISEQMFVPNGGPKEDDGWVVVQTIDGEAKKANVVVLDGATMQLLYRGQAPELALQGIHSRFFSFDQGCSIEEGCIPNSEATSTEAATTISNLASTFSFSNTVLSIVCIITLLCRNL